MIEYAQLLKKSDLKATPQRLQILEVIQKHGHTTIDEIYAEVSLQHSSLSLATVYKNIILMTKNKLLTEIPIVGMKSRYEISKSEHAHLICTQCGTIKDLHIDSQISKSTFSGYENSGFEVQYRQFNIYGFCGEC